MYKPLNVALFVLLWVVLLGAVVTAWNYRHAGYVIDRQTGTIKTCRSHSSRGGRGAIHAPIYRLVVELNDNREVSVEVERCSHRDVGDTVALLQKRRYLPGADFYVIDESQSIE